MDDSLFRKLKSLGVNIGTDLSQKLPREEEKFPIEEVLEGNFIHVASGSTFVVTREYPIKHHHGSLEVTPINSHPMVACCLDMPELNQCHYDEFLYLDTETSGLAGGTGAFVFLVGIGFFSDNKFVVKQIFLRYPGEERAFLEVLDQFANKFKTIVTFNGKSFDIPVLNNRYILNRMDLPFSEIQHIDILHLARKIWKNRLYSRTLGMLENEIIKFQRGGDEVPGWMVPEIYADYLHSGDARELAGVFYHNEMDILSLFTLHGHINELLENPLKYAGNQVLDIVAIASIYEKVGQIERAIELYDYSLDKSLPFEIYIQSLKRYAMIYKHREDWGKAEEIWKKLSKLFQYDACIELAKYYEHKAKDYDRAIKWSQEAETIIKSNRDATKCFELMISEIHHRIERLEYKRINHSRSH